MTATTYALARNTDPSTSHAAAASVTNLTEQESLVINTIKNYGPSTQEEVSDYTGVPRPAISPRFAPLLRRGLLQVVGKRPNKSGRKAQVFALNNGPSSE